uniref:Cytochrome P450 n=1 Tax=Nothapodytes nimmoniana TaxID=159386 RepID=A0A7L7RB46_NOTNI|nr:cytochrome P450 [Nothapodytes nimmoniana]
MMEIETSYIITFFTFLLFQFMVVNHWKKSKTQADGSKLPPGPWKLPLIGNLHQLVGSLPHHSLAHLARNHGPIMHLQLGEISTLVFSTAEAACEVLKTHDIIFADRPQLLAPKIMSYNCKDIGFSPYGDYWRQLRKICILELLSAKRVQSFDWIRQEEVSYMIESISQSQGRLPVNVSDKFFALSNAIVCRAAFGGKFEDQHELVELIKKAVKLAGGFDIPDLFPSFKILHPISGMRSELEKIHPRVDKIFDHLIEEHKIKRNKSMTMNSNEVGEEDLVDVLLKLQESGDLEFPITTDSIKAIILDMFTGGTETSSTVMGWAMSEMMRNPRVMKLAQAEVRKCLNGKEKIEEKDIEELNYLKLVIKETLRLHPPLPLLIPREAREKCQLRGYQVPVKTKVIVNAFAIGRDPKSWVNPESFEPERFHGSSIDFKGTNLEFIPFGAGRRICPGLTFGIANTQFPLAKLLYHFDWELPNGIKSETLDMTEAFGGTVTRKSDLYLIAKPYIPTIED